MSRVFDVPMVADNRVRPNEIFFLPAEVKNAIDFGDAAHVMCAHGLISPELYGNLLLEVQNVIFQATVQKRIGYIKL